MIRRPATARGLWSLRSMGMVLGAALALTPSPAFAATPAVAVNPDSGGPGAKVVLRGTGFCATPSCGTVTVTMGGFQVAGGVQPDAAGSFTAHFVVPGGLSSGQVYVVAKQTYDDGNEAQAMTGFLSSPSKGEEAERKAEEAETLQQLIDPSRPAATKGVPLAAAASQPAAAGGVSPGSGTPRAQDTRAVAAAADSGRPWWPYPVAVAVAALAALTVLVRRRNRADANAQPRG